MRILITAGPTREYFDSVRFISNPSTGKQGYAIARDATARGHQVVLIAGPVALADPPAVDVVKVTSAHEMYAAATSLFRECDAAILTAAVCDYRPNRTLDHKLKKQNRSRRISLVPTLDICAQLGRDKGNRIVIGFAMEDRDHRRNAESKLERKRCDAIVLNGIANVASDEAEVVVLRAGGTWSSPHRGTKNKIAAVVVDLVEQLAQRTRP